jgi:hypothetical protein
MGGIRRSRKKRNEAEEDYGEERGKDEQKFPLFSVVFTSHELFLNGLLHRDALRDE